MSTYINTKDLEFELESLKSKDLWTIEELLSIIYDLEDQVSELKKDLEDLQEDYNTYKEYSRPLTHEELEGVPEFGPIEG